MCWLILRPTYSLLVALAHKNKNSIGFLMSFRDIFHFSLTVNFICLLYCQLAPSPRSLSKDKLATKAKDLDYLCDFCRQNKRNFSKLQY